MPGYDLYRPWWHERLARRWLATWHGRGERQQYDYYRCEGCHAIITHVKIARGGCTCGSGRVRPAILSLAEKARLLLTPWRYA